MKVMLRLLVQVQVWALRGETRCVRAVFGIGGVGAQRTLCLERVGFTHRPLSSSFCGLYIYIYIYIYLDSYKVIPKRGLLRGLWVPKP